MKIDKFDALTLVNSCRQNIASATRQQRHILEIIHNELLEIHSLRILNIFLEFQSNIQIK